MALSTDLVAALGWALLDFVWQGVLVGAVAALALGMLRNARPQARYAVACLALAACLALPIVGTVRGLLSVEPALSVADAQVSGFAADFIVPAPAVAVVSFDWRASLQAQMPAIVAAWSAGALLLAIRLLLGCGWVGRLRAGARLPSAHWQGRCDEIAVRVGLRVPVPLRLSDAIDSPVTAGWWRPIVLLPAALLAGMPTDLLEALVAHELAHVRRRDYLVNLLQGAVESLLFYHPVVWWLSRQVRVEREQIADDLASRAIGEPRRLALALQELDRFQTSRPARPLRAPDLVLAAQGGKLMSRIKRLLRPDHQRPDWKLALPLAGLAALGLVVHAAQATAPAVSETPATPAITATPAVWSTPATPLVAVAPALAVTPVTAVTPSIAVTPNVAVTPTVAVTPVTVTTPVVSVTATVAPVLAGLSSIHRIDDRSEHLSYAMVREGRDGMMLSGNLEDMEEVRRARQHVHGDFLWFRRGGEGYLVQDAALLARARLAWGPSEEMGARMEALSEQMRPHSERMEALGKKMEALGNGSEPYAREMEALGKRMEPLAQQQSELAEKMRRMAAHELAEGADPDREKVEAAMQQLQSQMEGLGAKMEVLGRAMEEKGELMRRAQAPMEELGRQMEAAGRPMETLGQKMEVLGKQQEALTRHADAEVLRLIDDALREGKAKRASDLAR